MGDYLGCKLWSRVRVIVIVVDGKYCLVVIVLCVYWVFILFIYCIIYVKDFVGSVFIDFFICDL